MSHASESVKRAASSDVDALTGSQNVSIPLVADGIITRVGNYRWVICALLFFATTINYVDRQILGILATDDSFKHAIGWTEAQYGYITTGFSAAYAVGL